MNYRQMREGPAGPGRGRGVPAAHPQPLVAPVGTGLAGTVRLLWSVPTNTHLCSPPRQKGDRILPLRHPAERRQNSAPQTSLGSCLSFPGAPGCSVQGWSQLWREQSLPCPRCSGGAAGAPRAVLGTQILVPSPVPPPLSDRCVPAARGAAAPPAPSHHILYPFPQFPVNSSEISRLCVSQPFTHYQNGSF